MRRTTFLILNLLAFAAFLAAQDADLRVIPITGLPEGARIISYAVVEAENGERLVAEVRDPDAVTAFYLFVHAGTNLAATPIGPRTIPARFSEPPVHQPITRRVEGEPRRYWALQSSGRIDSGSRLLSAPNLEELRFSQASSGEYPLSPPTGSALTLSLLRLSADGELQESCVLEPNILAATDRLTTTGGWWVDPFDEPLLLVGVAAGGGGAAGEIRPRLYNERGELVAVSTGVVSFESNRVPDLVEADLDGDGLRELLIFSTGETGPPVLALELVRRGEARVLSFNLCGQRMNGADVIALQSFLLREGFSLGRHGVDGWYGPDTRAAVIRWQQATGRRVSGIVDLSQADLE